MASTSMTIKTFKEVASVLPPDRAILVRGDHGIGKSGVMKQVGSIVRGRLQEAGLLGPNSFPVIDKRAGQLTEGDVVGLPELTNGETRFRPPSWYKLGCREPAMLFFDELNRGTTEVMQALFQIVLDRVLDNDRLHPESRVVAAVNLQSIYTVNEIDPALLDRFFVVDLEPTAEEWLDWARSTEPVHGGNIHWSIVEFIDANREWLNPPKHSEPSSRSPSPRSWEFVSQSITRAGVAEDPNSSTLYHITRGFVGNEAAIAFGDFYKTLDTQVTGEQVINQLQDPKILSKVKKLSHDRLNGLLEKAGNWVSDNLDRANPQQVANIGVFINHLPHELRIPFWTAMVKHGVDKLELAKSFHPAVMQPLLDIFGVKAGEAGVGQVPNIPGFIKEQQAKAAKK